MRWLVFVSAILAALYNSLMLFFVFAVGLPTIEELEKDSGEKLSGFYDPHSIQMLLAVFTITTLIACAGAIYYSFVRKP